MELFAIWLSYSFVAGTAFPFLFFQGLPAWEPVKNFFPFLSFANFSLNAVIWFVAAALGVSGIINLLARRKKLAAAIFCAAAFFAAIANYYRVVDISSESHITNFLDTSFFDKTIVRGTIIADPDQRESATNIDIMPDEIVPDPETRPFEVIKLTGKTGYLRAKIYPSIGAYYYALSYGQRVEITSSLNEPKKLTNPAGFNYAAYLRARNIYAITRPIRTSEEIKYLGTGKIHWLWKISLGLKQRILLTIRKTMPYPESAFLGGVTLGLRGGVPPKVKSEFQATGVAHVLAVSGLHVGFVAFMLVALGKVIRIPSQLSFVFVAFGLIIFTLITGASPATRRAAIMFSMMEFFRSVMKMRLGHATSLTIPLTAMIILIFDPLKLPDGSFVLSFMAVWSLAMITGPVEGVFKLLGRGWIFLVFIAAVISTTVLVIVNPGVFQDTKFVYMYAAVIILIAILAYLRERKAPLSGFGIEYLPKWLVTFFYAQLAIQIGMMYPLSAVYFQRFPIAGMFANFIAIPLIGFIVQYGLLAGLFNTIFTAVGLPSVGITLALWINAFNWLCCKAFLQMATFFAKLFPYPYIPMPTAFQMVSYYSAVLLFVFYKPLSYQIQLLYMRLMDVFETGELKRRLVPLSAALALIVFGAAVIIAATKKHRMRVVFFDSGFGNSVLIESPDKKSFLIDAGSGGSWDFGSSALAPAFAKYKIAKLDYLVLSCFKSNNLGGAPYILNHWPVGRIILPYDPQKIPYGVGYKEFLYLLGDLQYIANQRSAAASRLYLSWYEIAKIINNKKIESIYPKDGEAIYQKKFGKNEFAVKILSVPSENNMVDNSIVVQVIYGDTKVLIPTQIGRDAQWSLVELGTDTLKSDVILVPKNGNPASLTDEFLAATSPKYAVIQYGYLPKNKRAFDYFFDSEMSRTVEKLKLYGAMPIRTDKVGAATIISDGASYEVETILKP